MASAPLPRDGFPDLLHKMSKKIAQLTKVIYHLNTRNEDSETTIRKLEKKHGDEVASILHDASEKIEEFKKQLEQRREAKIAHELKQQLENQHAHEKKEAMRAFADFKQLVSEREQQVHDEHVAQIQALKHQVNSLKEAYEVKCLHFEGKVIQFEEMEKQGGSRVTEIREAHQKEIEQLVQTSNEKFNTMLSERLQAEDTLKAELKEVEEVSTQKVEQLKTELEATVKNLKEDAAKEQASILHSQQILADEELTQLRISMEEKIKESNDFVLALKQKNGQLESELKDSMAKVEEFSKMQDDSQSELRATQVRLKEVQNDHNRLTQQLATQTSQHSNQVAAFERQLADMGSHQSTSEQELNDLKLKHEGLLKELVGSRRDTKAMRESSEKKEQKILNELKRLKEELSNAVNAQLESKLLVQKLSSGNKHEKNALQSKLEEAEKKANTLAKKLEEALKSAQELEEKNQRIATLSEKNKMEFEKRLKELNTETSTMKQQYLEEKESIRNELCGKESKMSSELQLVIERNVADAEEIRQQHTVEVSTLNAQIEALTSDLKSINTKLEEKESLQLKAENEINKLKDCINVFESRENKIEEEKSQVGGKLKEREIQLKSILQDKRKLEKELEESQMTIRELRTTMKEVRNTATQNMESQLVKAQSDFSAKMKDFQREANEKFKRDLHETKAQHASKLLAIEEAHRLKCNQLQEALEESKTQLENLKLELQRQTESHALEFETRESSWNQKFTNQVEDLKYKLSQQEVLSQRKTEEVESKYNAVIEEKEKAWQMKIEALHTEQEECEKLKQKMEKIRSNHQLEVADLKISLNTSTEQLRDKIEVQVSLRKDAEARLESVEEKRLLEVATLTKQLKTLENMMKSVETELAVTRRGNDELGKNVKSLKQDIHQLEEERSQDQVTQANNLQHSLAMQAKEFRDSMCAREEQLRNVHEQEIQNLQQTLFEKEEVLMKEIRTKSSEYEEKIQDLEQYIDQLRYQLDNRESRDEDVEQIHSLRAELSRANVRAVQLEDQLKNFKRELLNREQNYNKVFNRTPNVGVMQVVKPKQQKEKPNKEKKRRSSSLDAEPLPPLPLSGKHKGQPYWSRKLSDSREERVDGNRSNNQEVNLNSSRTRDSGTTVRKADYAPILGRRRSTGVGEVPHPPHRRPSLNIDIKLTDG